MRTWAMRHATESQAAAVLFQLLAAHDRPWGHSQAQSLDVVIRSGGATATSVRWRNTGSPGVAVDPPAAELAPGGTAALAARLGPLPPGAHARPLRMDAAGGYSLTTPLSCEASAISLGAIKCHVTQVLTHRCGGRLRRKPDSHHSLEYCVCCASYLHATIVHCWLRDREQHVNGRATFPTALRMTPCAENMEHDPVQARREWPGWRLRSRLGPCQPAR